MNEGIVPALTIPEHPLSATRLAQYATTRGRCERYLRFYLYPSERDVFLRRYDVPMETLSPLLSEEGLSFEQEAVEKIAGHDGFRNLAGKGADDFIAQLRAQAVGRTLYHQPLLNGRIGQWNCEGRADLVEVIRREASAEATVIDIKASRRETVGFRLQVAFYARLLAGTLNVAGLPVAVIHGAIVARDSDLEAEERETFDLALYDDEIERLVAAPNSDVARAARKTLETVSYHLGPKCDGCPYNAICFIDTAEREDLSLVPHLSSSEKRALAAEGVKSVRDLAGLMAYGKGAMAPTSGREGECEKISLRWPLGGKLPTLVQRARAALRRYDRTVEARSYLIGSDFGSLPDTERYPDLIKVGSAKNVRLKVEEKGATRCNGDV
jgi:predicted RecB family nuclease